MCGMMTHIYRMTRVTMRHHFNTNKGWLICDWETFLITTFWNSLSWCLSKQIPWQKKVLHKILYLQLDLILSAEEQRRSTVSLKIAVGQKHHLQTWLHAHLFLSCQLNYWCNKDQDMKRSAQFCNNGILLRISQEDIGQRRKGPHHVLFLRPQWIRSSICPSQQMASSFGGQWGASEEQFKAYLRMLYLFNLMQVPV